MIKRGGKANGSAGCYRLVQAGRQKMIQPDEVMEDTAAALNMALGSLGVGGVGGLPHGK